MNDIKNRLKEIEENIQELLNKGYNISDLNEVDRADLDGYIFGIYAMENAFDNLPCWMDDSIRGKIAQEEAEEIFDSVYSYMLGTATDLVYSHLDGYDFEEE